MRWQTVLSVAVSFIAASSPGSAQVGPPSDLDHLVGRAIQAFDVPGLALAVVKDGQVVVAKGYGVRELGDAAPVDGETLFGIASITKAFTATALAILVDEGRLAWDAPVIDYLPWFRMSDPYVTQELTIRDLLVHRSGLGWGAGDLLWWPESTYDRTEIARRIRHLPLSTSFRSTYAYGSVLYLVAGEVIEAVTGQVWEEFVASRIFGPVAMASTTPRYQGGADGDNVAATYERIDGEVRRVRPYISDNVNPVGGITSNAMDMAKWMIVQLDSGRVAGDERLYSARTTEELWTIVTPLTPGTPSPELAAQRSHFGGYALGLGVHDYRGQMILRHAGGLPGYASLIVMVPDYKLGIVLLTNMNSVAPMVIAYHILDHYLDADDTDWLEAYEAISARAAARAAASTPSVPSRDSLSGPSLPLEQYAMTYTDQWYGDVTVTHSARGLGIRFEQTPALVGDLEHWQHDTFVVRWRDRDLRADAFLTFTLGPEGAIEEARMRRQRGVDFSYDFQDLRLKPRR